MTVKFRKSCFLVLLCVLLWIVKSHAGQAVGRSPLDESFSTEHPYKSFSTDFPTKSYTPLLHKTALDKKGEWQPHGSFDFSTIYDSNLFNSRIDPKGDLIYSYLATVGFERQGDRAYFDTTYDLAYSDFVENEKLSRFGHSISSRFRWNDDRWKFNFENNFKPDSPYNVGERTEFLLLEPSSIIATSDTARAHVSYELAPQWKLLYTQRYSIHYFHNEVDEPFSSQAFIFNPKIMHEINDKTALYVSYSYRVQDFFKQGVFSSGQHIPRAGLVTSLGPTTELSANVGYAFRDYEDLENEDHDGLVAKVEVTQRLFRRGTLTLWGVKYLDENFDTSVVDSPNEDAHFIGADFVWRVSPALELKSGASAGFTSREGLATVADPDNSSLTFTRELESDFYGCSADVKWKLNSQWAVLLGYKFFNKNSSFKDFEYDDHKVVGSIRVDF